MKKTIMLIDDSVTIHRVIDICVDKDKYDVVKVFTKPEAESAFKKICPDLVLLDNKLADAKAAEMVGIIRKSCPGSYIVLLAGAFDQYDRQQCDAAGADDFIFKPFDAKALDAKILAGIETSSASCGVPETEPEENRQPEQKNDSAQPDAEELSDDETELLLGDMHEEIEIPPFEEEKAVEDEDIFSDDVFAGLKETEEEPVKDEEKDEATEQLKDKAQEPEPADVPADDIAGADDLLLRSDEIPDIDLDLLKFDEPEKEPDTITLSVSSNPFEGLVEAEELVTVDDTAKKTDEPEQKKEPEDEFENILDDINEETQVAETLDDITETLEDVEEALAEDSQNLKAAEQVEEAAGHVLENIESAADFDNLFAVEEEAVLNEEKQLQPEPENDISEDMVPEEPEKEAESEIDRIDFAADEPEMSADDIMIEIPEELQEMMEEEGLEIQPENQTSEPDTETGDDEIDTYETGTVIGNDEITEDKDEIPEPGTDDLPEWVQEEIKQNVRIEPQVPTITLSQEKLVEAVYEAIDEDILKYAVKEVLTDKISRILEDELPILVERAIRKEIERLVKGS